MQALVLHLQAPLMSFGGAQVDQIGPTGEFPTLSQTTGLLANALGYTHGDTERLQALQDRLSVASALVCAGSELEDYQTVDLGQPHLRNPAWTTRGRAEHRAGGPAAKYGTHIRYRRFRAGANVISALGLTTSASPTLGEISAALMTPARPLFIGRGPCVPSTPLLVGSIEDAVDLVDALRRAPAVFPERWAEIGQGSDGDLELRAEWPVDDRTGLLANASTHAVIDRRDWLNRLHSGERVVARGPLKLDVPAAGAGGAA